MTRSGRFDLKIRINLPNLMNRTKLINYFLTNIKSEKSLDVESLARMTVGFSPAELKNLVNIAMLNSISRKKFEADQLDF